MDVYACIRACDEVLKTLSSLSTTPHCCVRSLAERMLAGGLVLVVALAHLMSQTVPLLLLPCAAATDDPPAPASPASEPSTASITRSAAPPPSLRFHDLHPAVQAGVGAGVAYVLATVARGSTPPDPPWARLTTGACAGVLYPQAARLLGAGNAWVRGWGRTVTAPLRGAHVHAPRHRDGPVPRAAGLSTLAVRGVRGSLTTLHMVRMGVVGASILLLALGPLSKSYVIYEVRSHG